MGHRGLDGALRTSNQASVTHQTKFDLNRLQDRANEFICQISDTGFRAGGGQGPSSFLLPNVDSAHMEFVHPVSICSSVSPGSAVQPNLSSYEVKPSFVTGAPLGVLIDRVRSNLSFDELRVVPTGLDGGGLTFRFDPYDENETLVNAPMLTVWEKLVHMFYDVQVLDQSDPFHISMADINFCSVNQSKEFNKRNYKLTINPWIKWAKSAEHQNGKFGVSLNDEIQQYQNKTGGFYLFVTRNRPLIYFAPKPEGKHASGSRAFYCQWEQDGEVVQFANPFGGPVTETLVEIPNDVSVDDFINQHDALHRMSNGLCNDFAFTSLPTAKWTADQRLFVL